MNSGSQSRTATIRSLTGHKHEFCSSFGTVKTLISSPPKNMNSIKISAVAHSIVLHLFFFKVVCIPTVNGVPIPCNYANDTLMRCNCEFMKQRG